MRVPSRLFYVCLCVLMVGCAGTPQTTVLTNDDFSYVVEQTSAKFRSSDFLAGRSPTSPPISITVEKVENQTLDRIDDGKQWMFVMRIQGSVPIQTLADQKNISFQVTPERLASLRGMGYQGAGTAYKPPTHVMKAVFKSSVSTKNGKEGYVDARSDQYFLEYYIVELKSGSIAWQSAVEFRREALGNAIN